MGRCHIQSGAKVHNVCGTEEGNDGQRGLRKAESKAGEGGIQKRKSFVSLAHGSEKVTV